MFADRDFRASHKQGVGEEDLIADLELETLWAAMAQGDGIILQSVRAALLDVLTDPDQIRYRQAVLADCVRRPDVVRRIYALAVRAAADERQVHRSMFSMHGEGLVRRSITVLELFDEKLRELRAITDRDAGDFRSEGFTRFFEAIGRELDDAYFDEVADHLHRLRFDGGVLATARLGKHGQGVDYTLCAPRRGHRLLGFLAPAVRRPSFSWRVPTRDEAGGQAISALRDRILTLVANSVGESSAHITAFFQALRTELGFYVGCLNLHDRLSAIGQPPTMPDPQPLGSGRRTARGLYDACLSLRIGPVQSNDLDADRTRLIVITGANQGGKSTFLRSVGLAQLMMQAGMFVAADEFTATVASGVFSHYKREEDSTMTAGKFDEELARMSRLATATGSDALLLLNESFAATNEREGSDVAGDVIRAMTDRGNTVVFVTHLYEFAHRHHEQHADTTLFLRADRDEHGRRSYRIVNGEPLPTSYGTDLYRQIFATFQAPETANRGRPGAPT
jgi:MutS domain V